MCGTADLNRPVAGDWFRLSDLKMIENGVTLSEEKVLALVGLGNPGDPYHATRHNIGFHVVDVLARRLGLPFQERKFQGRWASGSREGEKILLFKPLTFMNRSGEALVPFLRYFEIAPSRMLVIHDDLDLSLGQMKLVRGGGAGGHRGVASIIQSVGQSRFPRLKLGIGRPARGEAVETYVLEPPYAEQRQVFGELILHGAEAAEAVISLGLEEAMNRFNRRGAQVIPT